MKPESPTSAVWFTLAVILVGVVLTVVYQTRQSPPQSSQSDSPRVKSLTMPPVTVPHPAESSLPEAVIQLIGNGLAGNGGGAARASLDRLKLYFESQENLNAVAEIIRVLDSGTDAPTTLGFKLNPDGSLKESPTLRTFLLDLLVQLDPVKAAAYAEKILSQMESADEWAVALRAYARGNKTPGSQTFLRSKFKEMLGNENWRNSPSVGFLESFDVVVYTRDKNLTPDIAKLIQQKDNPALAHAAYLALDRLVQVEPATVLLQLQAQPSLMTGRETTRADYFARADVTEPQQRNILENYLLDASRSPAELNQFAALYPNANYMVSPNLLTPTTTPVSQELAGRDAETLRVVREWLTDPRFERMSPLLQIIRSRLELYEGQRHQNPP